MELGQKNQKKLVYDKEEFIDPSFFKIQFEINEILYLAELRLVMIDRSKPYKLKPEDLPKRQVLQFQWKNFVETRVIFRKEYKEIYEKYVTGQSSTKVIKFNHLEKNIFLIR